MKKIISLILLCTLLPLQISFASAEGSVENSINKKSYQRAADFLSILEIMDVSETGEYKPDEKITRADFSVVLSRVMGFDNVLAGGYKGKFLDVDKSHSAFCAIEFMSDMGIVNGFENNYFYPNEPILLGHALKMLVVALGYNALAEHRGGYPSGYLMVAQDLELLKNVDITAQDPMPNAMAAQLIYNSLFVDLAQVDGLGEYATYKIEEGVNFLSENFDVVKYKGQVTGANGYTLIGDSIKEGTVKIDNALYEMGETDAEQYLGYYVEAFVRYYDGFSEPGTIIEIVPDEKRNDVITIDAKYIYPATNQNQLVYENIDNKNKMETLNIQNAFVIYNGRMTGDYTDADFKPASGQLVLIDTNGDRRYDVVHITSYEVCIVDSASNSVVTFKYGKQRIELDTYSDDFDCTFFKDGNEIAASSLEEWDVCSVKRTKDNDKCEVYVNSTRITGLINEISEEYVKIDDTKYELSKIYNDYINDPMVFVPEAQVGGEFALCFDIFGYVVAVKDPATTNYGYLINGLQTTGLDETVQFKIFTAEDSGMIKVLEGADTVRVNGNKLGKIVDEPTLYDSVKKKIKPQLVIYKTNSDGKLIELNTAKDKFNETINGVSNPDYVSNYIGYSEDEFSLDFAFTGQIAYRAGDMQTFDANKTRISDTCKVFIIPNVENPLDDEYKLYTKSYFLNDTYYKNLSFYDVTTDYEAKAIVCLLGDGEVSGQDSIAPATALAVVDKITQSVNQSGEVVPTFNGWSGGSYVSLVSSKEELKHSTTLYNSQYYGKQLKDLPQGSVIQYETNGRGEISQIRILLIPTEDAFFFESRGAVPTATSEYHGALYMGYGKVIKRTKNGIIYNAHSDGINQELDGTDRAWDRHISVRDTINVYLYDTTYNKIKKVNNMELRDEDIVFVQMNHANLVSLVIYR
ncbi:MAG: S-layer homology domain-containing protein [Clostridia bacterium]|nr:S-layer homology domain-containing protein [Clostridia bacterium]